MLALRYKILFLCISKEKDQNKDHNKTRKSSESDGNACIYGGGICPKL